MKNCPLCESSESEIHYKDSRRLYLRCNHCSFVFVPSQFQLNSEQELQVYDQHENNPDDSGYRKFLSRLTDPLCKKIPAGAKGLDFGCGPGPTLSVILEERGYSVDLYDIYYHSDLGWLDTDFDFITATEVVEHLRAPGEELKRLWSCLRPGGYLALMTQRIECQRSFAGWHYIFDPTHIGFWSEDSFLYLAEMLKSGSLEFYSDQVVFLQKKIS